jgi:hypothetical protein
MSDFCNCASCPHHCGSEDEDIDEDITDIKSLLDGDEKDVEKVKKAKKQVEKLKKDIKKLGFKLDDTKDGLRVSN